MHGKQDNKQSEQCTLLWHVDCMKISHKDPKVVTEIINKIKQQYGKIGQLTETHGKVHPYLGMVLNYSNDRKVIFQMYEFIKNMLVDMTASMQGKAATPQPPIIYSKYKTMHQN